MTAPDNACPVEQVARRIAAAMWSENDAALYFDPRYERSRDVRYGQAMSAARAAIDEIARQRTLPPVAEVMERVFYAAVGETSTEGRRWYIWRSGHGENYLGGQIADLASAEAIAAELNRLAALTNLQTGGGAPLTDAGDGEEKG